MDTHTTHTHSGEKGVIMSEKQQEGMAPSWGDGVCLTFPVAVIKHLTEATNGRRVYLAHNSNLQFTPLRESQGSRNLKQLVALHAQERAARRRSAHFSTLRQSSLPAYRLVPPTVDKSPRSIKIISAHLLRQAQL